MLSWCVDSTRVEVCNLSLVEFYNTNAIVNYAAVLNRLSRSENDIEQAQSAPLTPPGLFLVNGNSTSELSGHNTDQIQTADSETLVLDSKYKSYTTVSPPGSIISDTDSEMSSFNDNEDQS